MPRKATRKEIEERSLREMRPRELWPLTDITPAMSAYVCFEETGKIMRVAMCTPTDQRYIPVLFLYRSGFGYICMDMQNRSMIYHVHWNPNDGYRINSVYRKNPHKYSATLLEIAKSLNNDDFFED